MVQEISWAHVSMETSNRNPSAELQRGQSDRKPNQHQGTGKQLLGRATLVLNFYYWTCRGATNPYYTIRACTMCLPGNDEILMLQDTK